MSELSDLLGGLLGNESGGESEDISGLLGLLGGLTPPAGAGQARTQKEPSPDMGDLDQILKIVSSLQEDDKNIRLLRALQPHLTPDRAARAEDVIKLMRLANLLPLLQSFGSGRKKTVYGEERDDGALE